MANCPQAVFYKFHEIIYWFHVRVGKVVKIEKDQEAQKKVIIVELIEDFSNIHVGFVVKNNLRSEMIEIQKNE